MEQSTQSSQAIQSFDVCIRIRPLLKEEKEKIEIERKKKTSYPEDIVFSERSKV